ncbi:MAG: DUF6502 family protein [Steroidobacteraceae bacterium]
MRRHGGRLGRSNQGYGRTGASRLGQSILKRLLLELASILLQRGVTPAQFNELAEQAFVDAAAKLSRFGNGRVNQSGVAVLTGLRRGEVRRILAQTNSPTQSSPRQRSPVDTVIAGWCADKRYIDRNGAPKRLVISGAKTSFALLVKQYARDVPHRAVLNELTRLGVARQIGKHVQVQNLSALRQRENFASLAYLMPVIIDGIRIASNARAHAGSSSMRRLVLPAHNLLDLAMVRERCTSSIETMLSGLSASLTASNLPPRRAKQIPHSCSVSVLFVENKGS